MIVRHFERNVNGDFYLNPAKIGFGEELYVQGGYVDTIHNITELRRKIEKTLPRACGQVACDSAHIYIKTDAPLLEISAVALTCKNDDDCPYKNPPSNDNEPHAPSPTPPSLEAEVSL